MGSSVAVSLERVGGSVVLQVSDAGPGLSDADKELALTRFWRRDAGRPGSGLGLPIASSLVTAHHGTLDLLDAPGGGLLVRVALPAVTSSGPAGDVDGPDAGTGERRPGRLSRTS